MASVKVKTKKQFGGEFVPENMIWGEENGPHKYGQNAGDSSDEGQEGICYEAGERNQNIRRSARAGRSGPGPVGFVLNCIFNTFVGSRERTGTVGHLISLCGSLEPWELHQLTAARSCKPLTLKKGCEEYIQGSE